MLVRFFTNANTEFSGWDATYFSGQIVDVVDPSISFVDRPEGYILGSGGFTISVRATDDGSPRYDPRGHGSGPTPQDFFCAP